MQSLKQFTKGLLSNWIRLVQKYNALVVLLALVLALLAFNYTRHNLGMNTDTKDMLSPDLAWRQLDLDYEKYFPQYTDNILIVVEAGTADQALDGAALLYQNLLPETALFKSIYYPNALSVFRDSALLFLTTDELQDLADNLAAIQPFLSRLTEDQSMQGLFAMLAEAIDALEDGEEIDLAPLLAQINQALEAAIRQEAYRVSWHRLMSGEAADEALHRQFILLQPELDYAGLLPARPAILRIQELVTALGIRENIGAEVRLTGGAVLAYEELLSVSRGTGLAIVLALCTVTAIMLFGLGSLRLMLATLLTLLFGLILTATFAAFAIGKLNLISVAFAVLYIGLGVDFAIHYCLHYRELLFKGMENAAALKDSSVTIGGSLLLCSITTAIGFFAFIPTDYDGVAELGLISGVGMFISLLVTLSLLPALLSLMPLKARQRQDQRSDFVEALLFLPSKYAKAVKITSALVVIALLGFLAGIRFDYNTLNLQDPDNESVQTYQALLADGNTSPWTGIILAQGRAEALALYDKFSRLPVVEKVVWIEDFIPLKQDEKLALIDDMALLLGDLPDAEQAAGISDAQRMQSLRAFVKKLRGARLSEQDPAFSRLEQNLSEYLALLSSQERAGAAGKLAHLEQMLLASLPGRLETLKNSLNADYVSAASLPPDLSARWHSESDHYLLEIYPREDLNDNRAMRRFVEALQAADARIIGAPIINIEASDAVVAAFTQAFSYAFVLISVFLLILLKHKGDAIYILAPLLMAAVCTGGISVMLDIPLNFANIIALPLLLGIGVDSGIHMLHRFRTGLPENGNLLATSSARAVLVSTLTTIGSIGNLAFSPHLGTASMGKVLTIGIAVTLVCMLIVLPSLLHGRAVPRGQ